MFQGTVPEKALKVIANVVKNWNCQNLYVGCSGNFTIERCVQNIFKGKIFSNDVTIYSSVVGRYFAGEDLGVTIKDEYNGPSSYFRDYWKDDTEKVATLIMAADILKYDTQSYAYFVRMRKAYEEQWPVMHKTMCEKMKKIKLRVEKFYCGDVMNYLDGIDEADGFVSFPPQNKGGYERMWKDLETMFEFEKPDYKVFDPAKDMDLLCEKMLKLKNFCLCTEKEVPMLESYYTGTIEAKKGRVEYIYSRTDKKIFVKNSSKHSVLSLERIREDDDIDGVELCKLSHEQFDELRAVYLNRGIDVARESSAYGLTTHGKLFGCFAFSTSLTLDNFDSMIEGPSIYMMTDFAVGPTKVKKLSKLVLYCILSKEVKMVAEHDKGKRVRSIVTNAFCKNHMSMKYRGMFEMLNNKEVEVAGGEKRYNVTYGAVAGQWTLQEGYEKWKQKS